MAREWSDLWGDEWYVEQFYPDEGCRDNYVMAKSPEGAACSYVMNFVMEDMYLPDDDDYMVVSREVYDNTDDIKTSRYKVKNTRTEETFYVIEKDGR